MGRYKNKQVFNLFGNYCGNTFQDAEVATSPDISLQNAQNAMRQGQEILSGAPKSAEDLESYMSRIKNVPIDELARRFDYKTKIAVEELLSLSSFMKKSLLYLAGMATLSIYLNLLMKKK